MIEILDGAVVVALCGIGIATIVIGDSQGSRRALTRIDERRATINPRFERRAIQAVAQLNIPEIVTLGFGFCAAAGDPSNSKMRMARRRWAACTNFHTRLPDFGIASLISAGAADAADGRLKDILAPSTDVELNFLLLELLRRRPGLFRKLYSCPLR